jgi:cytochrome c
VSDADLRSSDSERWLIQYGFSAREKPTLLEAFLVRRARRWAIPAKAKHLKNPMPANTEMLERGRNHWADHCATCHANNGSGETEIGRSLFPKAPDMRGPETQTLRDGELYYIIRKDHVAFTRQRSLCNAL